MFSLLVPQQAFNVCWFSNLIQHLICFLPSKIVILILDLSPNTVRIQWFSFPMFKLSDWYLNLGGAIAVHNIYLKTEVQNIGCHQRRGQGNAHPKRIWEQGAEMCWALVLRPAKLDPDHCRLPTSPIVCCVLRLLCGLCACVRVRKGLLDVVGPCLHRWANRLSRQRGSTQ